MAVTCAEGDRQDIIQLVQLQPFGVLGTALTQDKRIKNRAELPESGSLAIVDPAGLHHIQPPGRPAGAGGAAGSIYKWLGINDAPSFPLDVIAAIRAPGDAKYHCYSPQRHVIHAVGPDLRQAHSEDAALKVLARAYRNIFAQFIDSNLPELRLLPVSGGIFSGSFKDQMPVLTMLAITEGFYQLSPSQQSAILDRKKLYLCIFMDAEFGKFQAAKLRKEGSVVQRKK